MKYDAWNYIAMLPSDVQTSIRRAIRRHLYKGGMKGTKLDMAVEDAMDGRLIDLKGAINIQYYLDKANGVHKTKFSAPFGL